VSIVVHAPCIQQELSNLPEKTVRDAESVVSTAETQFLVIDPNLGSVSILHRFEVIRREFRIAQWHCLESLMVSWPVADDTCLCIDDTNEFHILVCGERIDDYVLRAIV